MKLSIESTNKITELDGVPCRYWEGVTEAGVRCHLFVHRIAVHNDDDASDFECDLHEMAAPSGQEFVPLRMILD